MNMGILELSTTLGITAGVAALIYVVALIISILRIKIPTDRAAEIHGYIKDAALTYMKRQYSIILTIAFTIGIVIIISGYIWSNNVLVNTGIAYIVGALSSSFVGVLGMYIAVLSNVRVLRILVEKGLRRALRIAFRGGAVTGFMVGGIGLLGISLLFIAFGGLGAGYKDAVKALLGYAFGASTVALFARVGGGIYTKAADVGADLVGKVEVGIPEDDPRNPGVIADNVGDNVGDCAGMSADLFESYVESIVAAMAIGMLIKAVISPTLVAFPLLFASVALLTTILTAQLVEVSPIREPSKTLTTTSLISIIGVATTTLLTTLTQLSYAGVSLANLWGAGVLGLIAGGVVGFTSDYFTSGSYRPVRTVAASSRAGPALTILSGLSMGFYSTVAPAIAIAIATYLAYNIGVATLGEYSVLTGGVYAIALSGVGMLSVASIVVAADAYGPIVDNTAGLAEQAGYPEEVREQADKLDAAGNTMKSISKGYAIGSAALTALALLFTYASLLKDYADQMGIRFDMQSLFTLTRSDVLAGLLIGAAIPAFFTALVIQAVTAAAFEMVEEIRRQFRERPGILEWKEKPDYNRAVDIVTRYALKRLIAPGTIALVMPVIVGVLLGPIALGGMLMGSIITGLLLGLFQGNVGNTWDNAKKFIEEGSYGGKGSEAHKAAVIGDTVGDPLKDAAGPSLNILIKLMAIASSVFLILILSIRLALGLLPIG